MGKRSRFTLGLSLLVTIMVFALPGCSSDDQPDVVQLTKEQAAKKQTLDDQMRTRLLTTQSDR